MIDDERLKKMSVEIGELTNEFLRLKSFQEAMLEQQPYKVGDRVQLTEAVAKIDYEKAFGWLGSKHLLQPGNTGTICDVRWNEYARGWQVAWKPDVDWSRSSFRTSSQVWIVHESRRHLYYMPYRYVCHAGKKRKPILPPPDAAKYELVDIPEPESKFAIGRRELSYKEVLEMFGDVRV